VSTVTWIEQALQLPKGARFLRCALQVNPFAYLEANAKVTACPDEAACNAAMVQACKDNAIDVIGITDHFRVRSSVALWDAAEKAGVNVLPGFEAVTKDGVHLLCLFDHSCEADYLERILSDCGIHTEHAGSLACNYDAVEFLEQARTRWGAICIAAHVAAEGGLLKVLTGQPRVRAWQSEYLLACSLPGAATEAPDRVRPIIENTNADYRRDRRVAVVNAQDVCDPVDLATASASCWIKMSGVGVTGLHQAFVDPESRVRLASDPTPEEHTEFVALGWKGGFLDGTTIPFNENLNVLIWGRRAHRRDSGVRRGRAGTRRGPPGTHGLHRCGVHA
jgi:hypothetical protein